MSTLAVGLLGEVRGDFAHLQAAWFDSQDVMQRQRDHRDGSVANQCESCGTMAATASSIANTLSKLEKDIKTTLESATSPLQPADTPQVQPHPVQAPAQHETGTAVGSSSNTPVSVLSSTVRSSTTAGRKGKLHINHQGGPSPGVECAAQ